MSPIVMTSVSSFIRIFISFSAPSTCSLDFSGFPFIVSLRVFLLRVLFYRSRVFLFCRFYFILPSTYFFSCSIYFFCSVLCLVLMHHLVLLHHRRVVFDCITYMSFLFYPVHCYHIIMYCYYIVHVSCFSESSTCLGSPLDVSTESTNRQS